MDAKDITQRQLETLVLVRSLEEFITDEHENLTCLSDVIFTFEENMTDEEHTSFVKDIVKLTETGYLVSDASGEDIELDNIPEVEGITPKGTAILNEFEQETEKKAASGIKVTLCENFSLFHTDISLPGGIEMNVFKEAGGLFRYIGKRLKSKK